MAAVRWESLMLNTVALVLVASHYVPCLVGIRHAALAASQQGMGGVCSSKYLYDDQQDNGEAVPGWSCEC